MSSPQSGLYIANLTAVNRELRRMGKEWDQELRDASGDIAADLAMVVRARASSSGYPQDARVAPTIRARRSNRPAVTWGGRRRVFSGGGTATDVVYGAEFGGGSWRFPKPHRGHTGYYLYPEVRRSSRDITEAYFAAVEAVWDRAARAVT